MGTIGWGSVGSFGNFKNLVEKLMWKFKKIDRKLTETFLKRSMKKSRISHIERTRKWKRLFN